MYYIYIYVLYLYIYELYIYILCWIQTFNITRMNLYNKIVLSLIKQS